MSAAALKNEPRVIVLHDLECPWPLARSPMSSCSYGPRSMSRLPARAGNCTANCSIEWQKELPWTGKNPPLLVAHLYGVTRSRARRPRSAPTCKPARLRLSPRASSRPCATRVEKLAVLPPRSRPIRHRIRAPRAQRMSRRVPAGPVAAWNLAVSCGTFASPAPVGCEWGGSSGRRTAQFAMKSFSSHLRALMADHLLDGGFVGSAHVTPWLSGKLDFSPPSGRAADGFSAAWARASSVSRENHRGRWVYQRRNICVHRVFNLARATALSLPDAHRLGL